MKYLLILLLLCSPLHAADIYIDGAKLEGVTRIDVQTEQAAKQLTPTKPVTSVEQYGIEIHFDQAFPAGQYINGDWFVVGPVTVTKILVAGGKRVAGSVAGQDGAMIDPVPATSPMQGYDSRGRGYSAELNVSGKNFELGVGQSLVCSESADPAQSYSPPSNLIFLETAIVLTCVSEAPPEKSFRPQYCAGPKTQYRWSDVDLSRLPALKAVASTPKLASVQDKLARVQLDHGIGWSMRNLHPYQNMRDYGRDLCAEWGNALLMSLLDEQQVGDKSTLVVRLVQLGIDLHGIRQAGGRWPADGGHGMGRKAPIMFAGLLLGVPEMRDIGYAPDDFQEDAQAFYVSKEDVDRAHKPQRTKYKLDAAADYTTEDIGIAEWGLRHTTDPAKDDRSLSASYRSNNSSRWKSHALPMVALGLQESWGHNAYFDYLERIYGSPVESKVFRDQMFDVYWSRFYKSPNGKN